jgi:hypothetical protein
MAWIPTVLRRIRSLLMTGIELVSRLSGGSFPESFPAAEESLMHTLPILCKTVYKALNYSISALGQFASCPYLFGCA